MSGRARGSLWTCGAPHAGGDEGTRPVRPATAPTGRHRHPADREHAALTTTTGGEGTR